MNLKTMILPLSLGCAVGLFAGTEQKQLIFEDCFDYYGYHCDRFTDASAVWEAPGSIKTMHVEAKDGKRFTMMKKDIAIPNGTADFEVSFRFRFYRNSARDLQVLIPLRESDKKVQYLNVWINDGCATISGYVDQTNPARNISLHRFLMDLPPFPDGYWHKAVIRCVNGGITVDVERDGKMVREAASFEAKRKVSDAAPSVYLPIAGLNFATKSSFGIDDIRVSNITPDKAVTWAPEQTLPADAFSVCPNVFPGRIILRFNDGSEKPPTYTMNPFTQDYTKKVQQTVTEKKDGKDVTVKKFVNEKRLFVDTGMKIQGPKLNTSLYTFPRLRYRFEDDEIPGIVADPELQKQRASTHTWQFRTVKTAQGYELYIDGNYVCVIPAAGEIKSVTCFTNPDSTVRAEGIPAAQKDPLTRVIPLDAANSARTTVDGITFEAFSKNRYFDTGKCAEHLGSFYLECDGYLSRSAFEAIPGTYHRRLPVAPYYEAYAICSLDPDTTKTSEVSVRLTRFIDNGGRSPDAMAENTVTLPRDPAAACPAGVKRLADGMFLVKFNIPIGKIQDVLFMQKSEYLDFEVLGGMYEKDNYYLSRANKPSLRPSGVRVHAVTLKTAPAAMVVQNGNIGNVFYPDEAAGVTVDLKAYEKGDYTVNWQISDLEGKTGEWQSASVKLDPADPEPKQLKLSFDKESKAIGWYGIPFKLMRGNQTIMSYNAALVRLPADTRKAGYESPYFIWNFNGAHGTPSDMEEIGTVLKRLGVRRTLFRSGQNESSEVSKKYGLTLGMFPSPRIQGNTPEERKASLEGCIKKYIEDFPHVKLAMIFHESGGGPVPMELLGEKTELTPEVIERDKKRTETALEIARAWRRLAPDVKIIIGNSGESVRLLAQLFRQKFPADLIDYMGEESVGMTQPPERSVAYPFRDLKDLAEFYGYDKITPAPCFEWKSRVNRHFAPRKLAAFCVRDTLLALSWESPVISLVGISEMANSYYNTIWGYGAFTRYPLFQPTPTFSAVAVMTQVLDQVKFKRVIPTGSRTVYALEFQRPDGKLVYAVWTARGNVSATLTTAEASLAKTDLFGRESELKAENGSVVETITEEPVYLVGKSPLKSISVATERTYPCETAVIKSPVTVAPLNSMDGLKLVMGEDLRVHTPLDPMYLTALKPGKFTAAAVKDEKAGDCIEITLVPEGNLAPLYREYGFLRFEKPVEIKDAPNSLGISVKGNSSWGKIFFELEDADGETWISAGTGGYGCYVYDWPERMGINFDGWHDLTFPLTAKSSVKIHSPGDNQWQWQSNKTGDGAVTYPVKLKGIGFALARKTLCVKEYEDVTEKSIRIRNFFTFD